MHTPGPWKADPSSWGGRHRISGNHVPVAESLSYDDARLIAAAPDYDAAARAAVESYRTPRVEGRRYVSISIEAFQALEAAIAKAED